MYRVQTEASPVVLICLIGQNTSSALVGYAGILRQLAVFSVGEDLWNSAIGPANERESASVKHMGRPSSVAPRGI